MSLLKSLSVGSGLTHIIPVAAGRTGWFVPNRGFAASFPSNLVLQMEADKKRSCDFPQLARVGWPPDTPKPPKLRGLVPPPAKRERNVGVDSTVVDLGRQNPPLILPRIRETRVVSRNGSA